MSKKICFLISNMNNSGGTERVCSIIANGLADNGYEVMITSVSEGNKPFFPLNKNIKINSLVDRPGRVLYRLPNIIYRLRKLLIRKNVDVLIVVETMSVLFTLPAIQGLFIKHICWEHFNFNSDLGRSSRRLARQLAARYCDVVVTLTERDKSYWKSGTFHRNQIISIPNPSPFKLQNNLKKINTRIVLAVGRLTHQKGFDLLLQSWVQVTKHFPDWKLVIVGEGEDRTLLENYIVQKGMTSKIELVGNTYNVGQYYELAEIFCLSSRFEGFPMVLLETLAYGIPVVAFDCDTGPSEILENTGSLLVPKENIELLADALMQFISNDNLRSMVGFENLQRSRIYQPNLIIYRWIEMIESLDH